jgi:hypothetical protein
MESDFIWQCARKKKHKTRERAESSLEKGLREGHYGLNYHVYYCSFCTFFHIGKQSLIFKDLSTEPLRKKGVIR